MKIALLRERFNRESEVRQSMVFVAPTCLGIALLIALSGCGAKEYERQAPQTDYGNPRYHCSNTEKREEWIEGGMRVVERRDKDGCYIVPKAKLGAAGPKRMPDISAEVMQAAKDDVCLLRYMVAASDTATFGKCAEARGYLHRGYGFIPGRGFVTPAEWQGGE